MPAETTIYFARHGQSVANADAVAAGSSDSPLTDKGIAQASEEARHILQKTIQFDTIIASSLSRALDTAKIIANHIGFDPDSIIVSNLLWERSLGSFEGALLTDFYDADEATRENAGCEKLEDLFQRVQEANEFVKNHAKGTTLVVGHSGFYRMARCVAEGLQPEETYSLDQPKNSSLLEYPL